MSTVKNKVVLITGASRGIGAQMALDFAAQGAKVIINYAGNKTTADELVAKITANNGSAIAVQADVSNSQAVKEMFDQAIAHYGHIDVLVNNAGIMIIKPIKDTTDDDFTRQMEINIRGVFNTLREAATRLADNGAIINFSTSVNRIISPGYATYVASKSAVEQLTRVFAKEMGSRGINVNSVSPGPTNTELFTQGKSQELIDRLAATNAFNRIAEPEDISKVVLFLASDDAKWISAQNIGANGAMA